LGKEGMTAEPGTGWRRGGSGVGYRVAAELRRVHQLSRGWEGSRFRCGRGRQRIRAGVGVESGQGWWWSRIEGGGGVGSRAAAEPGREGGGEVREGAVGMEVRRIKVRQNAAAESGKELDRGQRRGCRGSEFG